jgi:hypothetical protein
LTIEASVVDFPDFIGQADVAEAEHPKRNLPQNETEVGLGPQDRDAKAGLVAEGETEVRAAVQLRVADMSVGRDRDHQLFGVRRGQRGTIDRRHTAADPQSRGLADLEVKIRRPLFDHQVEQVVHFVAHDGKWGLTGIKSQGHAS